VRLRYFKHPVVQCGDNLIFLCSPFTMVIDTVCELLAGYAHRTGSRTPRRDLCGLIAANVHESRKSRSKKGSQQVAEG